MQTASLAGIAQLSVTERIQLAQDIWDTIAAHPDGVSLPAAQVQELGRRIAAYQTAPQSGAPWADVQQRILARR